MRGVAKWVEVETPSRLNAGAHEHSTAAITTGEHTLDPLSRRRDDRAVRRSRPSSRGLPMPDRPFRKFPRWRAHPGRPALTLAVTRGAILSTSARAPGGGPPCWRPPQGRAASSTERPAFGANPEDPENTRILSAASSPVARG